MFKRLGIPAIILMMLSVLTIPLQTPSVSAASSTRQLILIQQTKQMYDGGILYAASQPMAEKQGVTYVAARSIGERLGLKVAYNSANKEYILSNERTKLVYKLNTKNYTVNGVVSAASGAPYEKSGSLMIPLRSLVSPLAMSLKLNAQEKKITLTWSESLPVTEPDNPPTALFATDKDTYKMGELIQYTDQSTDDKGIAKTEWTNNKQSFFNPGQQLITLRVTDTNGSASEYSRTITITSEQLYSEDDFNRLYTPIGDKFPIVSSSVLNLATIAYTPVSIGQQTLIRANSPETIIDEGIYYSDTVSGNVRFLIHNQNNRTKPARIYIIATNVNTEEASVQAGRIGIGGPSTYVSATGKAALARYMEGKASNVTTRIPAGESRIVLSEISNTVLATGKVITVHADVQTSAPIQFNVVVVDADKDVFQTLPYLSVLDWDGKHARGTFENADRYITISSALGGTGSRMVLADKTFDSYLPGIDATTGGEVTNSGNYGVNYKLTLEHVQPNTLIALNARGGHYGGAFLVNGKLTYMTTANILNDANEAGVLYRTGSQEESVTIEFSPASGSNLPINMLFLPLTVK